MLETRNCQTITRLGIALSFFLFSYTPIARAQIGDELIDVQPNDEQMAMQGEVMIGDGPQFANPNLGGWNGRRSYYNTESMRRSQILQILQTPRAQGSDTWAWRETVENSLVGISTQGLAFMRTQYLQRDGYEADALQVAIFRLENLPLDPHDALLSWATRYFTPGPADPPQFKITRVLDLRATVGLGTLFPHHLFYAVTYPAIKGRVVVALAADAKVQPLNDDAALAAFFRCEAPPQSTQIGKERLAAAATLLATERSSSIYKPDAVRVDVQLPDFNVTLDAPGVHQTATLTFDPAGRLQTIAAEQAKVENKPAPIINVPTTAAPPPAMPD
jgi:hypothetical protein